MADLTHDWASNNLNVQRNHFSMLLSFFLLASSLLSCTPNDIAWKNIEIDKENKVNVQGLSINKDEVILAFGYDEKNYNCGFAGVGYCRMYKIYRSFDKGSSWQDITDETIGIRHSFLKGDKISPVLFEILQRRYGNVIRIGEKFVNLALYSEFRNKGRFFSSGKDFYLYVDFILYHSSDLGSSWKEITIDNNFIIPSSSTAEFVEDYLTVFDPNTLEKILFKRQVGLFKRLSMNKFVVIHTGHKKELLFSNGKNLASDYYHSGYISTRKKVDENGDIAFCSAYKLKNNKILANFSNYNGGYASYMAGTSTDGGKSFSHSTVTADIETPEKISRFEVIGVFKNIPVVAIAYDYTKFELDRKYRINNIKYFLWDVEASHVVYTPVPLDIISFTGSFTVGTDYVYYASEKGLYRCE